MKYEWKKREKELYGAKPEPALITVPRQNYIMLEGSGDPNGQDFSDRVSALFASAYAVKMLCKAAAAAGSQEVQDFTVYPLEGVWGLKRGGRLVKEELEYTVMIRQPDFVTQEIVAAAWKRVKAQKPNPLYAEMRFDAVQDGRCIEILHIGPYDAEPASFEKLAHFAGEHGLVRRSARHREIYLNNAGRVEASRLKTILRCTVE